MILENKSKALELVIKSIPYPQHLSDIDINSEEGYIRFTWRNDNKFRLSLEHRTVEEVGDGVLMGSDIAILLEALLKENYMKNIT